MAAALAAALAAVLTATSAALIASWAMRASSATGPTGLALSFFFWRQAAFRAFLCSSVRAGRVRVVYDSTGSRARVK
jgi:hypothetical protein